MIEIQKIIEIAKKAGEKILEVYESDFSVEYKKDDSFKEGFSPLTEADKISNKIISAELKKNYPEIPILSEENEEIPYSRRKNWDIFWLVDPIDGTKGFIKRNGEFTVNIALIENQKPVLGVVYAPVSDTLYYSAEGKSFKQIGNEKPVRLPSSKNESGNVRIVASKNHLNEETLDFIEEMKKEREVELVSIGSSLKLCLVAEGKADVYPRLGPTKEWDTAAAHAVVNGAGKKVYEYKTEKEIVYNKENLLNPWFVVK